MTRYWVIAPYDSRNWKVFDHVWNYDLEHGTIAVGWTSLGDIGDIEKDDLWEKVAEWREDYPDIVGQNAVSLDTNAIWNFHHKIKPGDKILARKGRMILLAVGTVVGEAYFDLEKGKERVGDYGVTPYPRFIDVEWKELNIEFGSVMFAMNTLTGFFDEDYYQNLIQDMQEDEGTSDIVGFRLEKQLEDFVVTNMDMIFNGEYEVFIDDDGRIGQQYPVYGESSRPIGYIDILAKRGEDESYLVIELKKGQSPDETVGQVLRYMGWVKENLDENVKGLILCTERDERMEHAVSMVSDLVSVKYYEVSFTLHDEPPD